MVSFDFLLSFICFSCLSFFCHFLWLPLIIARSSLHHMEMPVPLCHDFGYVRLGNVALGNVELFGSVVCGMSV